MTDNVTGLVWQQTDDDVGRGWANAISYCENLALAGATDWRLPYVHEMHSLMHYGATNSIDARFFPGTTDRYWLRNESPDPIAALLAWFVSFDNCAIGYVHRTTNLMARCVR